MTTEYRADLGPIDEDGYRVIIIEGTDGYRERYYLRYDIAGQWVGQELDILRAMAADDGDCEHGLSKALCRGPNHY